LSKVNYRPNGLNSPNQITLSVANKAVKTVAQKLEMMKSNRKADTDLQEFHVRSPHNIKKKYFLLF
jgi:hypothetical protein